LEAAQRDRERGAEERDQLRILAERAQEHAGRLLAQVDALQSAIQVQSNRWWRWWFR